jgi:hypothetical protein
VKVSSKLLVSEILRVLGVGERGFGRFQEGWEGLGRILGGFLMLQVLLFYI